MSRFRSCLSVLVFLMVGCGLTKPDPEADALGRKTVALLESGDSSSLMAVMDSSLTTYTAWGQLSSIRDTLRTLKRDSTTLIGWHKVEGTTSYSADVTYQLDGEGRALMTIVMSRHEHHLVVTGIQIRRIDSSAVQANDFHLGGESPMHFVVLFAALLCAAFSIAAAILVARTPMPKRWLWAFVALIGVGQLAINWTTGETTYSSLRFLLFSAAFLRAGPAEPWIISFTLPAGAAYSLWRRHQYRNVPPPAKGVEVAPSTVDPAA